MADAARMTKIVGYLAPRARALARRVRGLMRIRGSVPCLVCGSRRTHVTVVTRERRTYEIRVCERCGYLSNFDNTADYSAFESVEAFKLSARVGTPEHEGREFHMAQMGVDILARSGLHAMVFGAGRSVDYQRIGRLAQVDRVVMSDVVELTSEADFINILEGTDERFDLIIACEVVEHFTDPRTEFRRLFELLTPDGLLVCSTNIYDGGNFAKHNYLYSRGHVSYYSRPAIKHLARRSRMAVDFRTPAIVQGVAGPRKRYLLFTRSTDNVQRTREYFADRKFAPSEDVAAFEARYRELPGR